MTTTDIRRQLAASETERRRVVDELRDQPGRTHELISALTSDIQSLEDGAADALLMLATDAPQVVEPFARRLFRIAAGTENKAVRLALAQALPLIELGPWQAGRLAFVFESWLDDRDGDIKRAAMEALVALVPQRPRLGPRVRQKIERMAAEGSPTAIHHGVPLLERLREF